MTFEEQFPELKEDKGRRFFYDCEGTYWKTTEIQKACLSKQRFREAIKKLSWINKNGEPYISINGLLKELGLEK